MICTLEFHKISYQCILIITKRFFLKLGVGYQDWVKNARLENWNFFKCANPIMDILWY